MVAPGASAEKFPSQPRLRSQERVRFRRRPMSRELRFAALGSFLMDAWSDT